MISVLIVDDEKMTREGLIRHFDWNKYDAKIVAQAEDGKEALDFLDKYEPDIIFCDVKMAKMDGITFAQHLCKRGCKSKIVFISGYDNVSYIRSALRLKAIDYILKPINFSDLNEVMERIVNQIKEEKCAKEQYEDEQNIMRALIIKKLLQEDSKITFDDQKELDYLKIDGCSNYILTVWHLKKFSQKYVNEKEIKALFFAVQNILTELIGREFSGYVVNAQDNNNIIGVIGLKNEQSDYNKNFLDNWTDLIENILAIEIESVCGNIFDNFFELKEQYFNLTEKFDDNEMYVIRCIKEYIDNNYYDKITINDIADAVYINHTYACVLFKKVTGITINQYITDVRMKKALNLIKSRRYKLYEISDMVGYSDSNYFNKLLKKYCGKTFKEIDREL